VDEMSVCKVDICELIEFNRVSKEVIFELTEEKFSLSDDTCSLADDILVFKTEMAEFI